MKGRSRIPLFVVSLALLGLIGLLATLQYRWLGRISEAERDRMRATLETSASALAQDFDAELTRAYLLFQSDPLADTTDMPTRFASRHDRWQATSKFPRVLKSIYAFTPGATPRLEHFDPATRSFTPAEWPASMHDWRAHVVVDSSEQRSARGQGATLFVRRLASPVWESAPAIVVPSPLLDLQGGVPPRLLYTILELDREYMVDGMLPALVQQHFTRLSGADFQVAVVSRPDGGRVIYRSNDTFAPAPGGTGDATADLFSVRTQDFSRLALEVHRFTAFASTLKPQPSAAGQRFPPDKRRESIVVERTAPAGAPLAPADSATPPGPAATDSAASRPAWQLIVAHHAGSLEAAVATARRRNLLLSSSILGVLCASMGLLLLATRRAQRLAEQQMEFVATVSHELRTPLAVIRSAADNLADGVVTDGTQVRRYGELVRHEGRRLTDMVEQVLEFSGIESGERRLNATPVEVAPLVRNAVDASAHPIRDAGITVALDLPSDLPPVLGDEPALGRVLQNLIANAIKYGAAGGWIGVAARSDGKNVLITVADRGIGIDPCDQARIFEPFYRAPGVVEAQIQGAGLGLSLVRRIVDAHGGTVSVRSVPAGGASFMVQLPVASPARPHRAADDLRQSTPASPPAPLSSGAKAARLS